MFSSIRIYNVVVYVFVCVSRFSAFKKFDDSLIFRLDWSPDSGLPDDILNHYRQETLPPDATVVVSSIDSEKYVCMLPDLVAAEEANAAAAAAEAAAQLQSPLELLEEFTHKQRVCTYRIETYWTYELCHGRFLRQYHEEKLPNNKIKLQEYYLGQYIPEEGSKVKFDPKSPPKRRVEDQNLPYFTVKYIQGTVCDINLQPRVANIHYVCIPDAKNQVYSLDEVSSCEYEVVVLTNFLCSHPSFRAKGPPENKVECFPVDGAPPKPTSLTLWSREAEYESKAHRKHTVIGLHGQRFSSSSSSQGATTTTAKPASKQRLTTHVPSSQESPSAQQRTDQSRPEAKKDSVVPPPDMTPVSADSSLTKGFLTGEYCRYGGTGWWKHEYCHGRQVIQFHEDPKTGARTEVLLGVWNREEHFDWIAQHSFKRPVRIENKVRQVSHFYGHGDRCEMTGRDRTVEVRLKCRETAGSPNAVTLYLLEPKTCEYVLGVESRMLCDVIQETDENGMLVTA